MITRPPRRRLRDSHPLRRPVPAVFRSRLASARGRCRPLHHRSSNPRHGIAGRLCRHHGLGSSPFARRYWGNPLLFLGVLRCFSSPGAPSAHARCPAVRRAGCPIRRPPDHRLPAPPRGISPRGRVLPRPPTPRHPPCARLPDRSAISRASPRWSGSRQPGPCARTPPHQPRTQRLPRDPWFRCSVCSCSVSVTDSVHQRRLDVSQSRCRVHRAGRRPPAGRPRPVTAANPGGSRVARCQGAAGAIDREVRRSRPDGWSRGDSNPGPPPCKGGALPAKLRPPDSASRRPPRPRRGGRAWTRTRDLGLIRAAL